MKQTSNGESVARLPLQPNSPTTKTVRESANESPPVSKAFGATNGTSTSDQNVDEHATVLNATGVSAVAGCEDIDELNTVINQKAVNPGVNRTGIKLLVETKGVEGKEDAVHHADVEAEKANSAYIAKVTGLLQLANDGLVQTARATLPLIHMLSGTRPFINVRSHVVPYTKWEILKICGLTLCAVVLLVMSGTLVAVNLNSTGMPAFQSWAICILFSPLALLSVLPIKLLASRIASLEKRERFAIVVVVIGGSFMLIWVWLFSILFPGMAVSTGDIVQAALTGRGDGIPDWLRRIYVAVQLTAEACLSAAIWLEVENTVSEHTVVVPKTNPARLPIEEEIKKYKRHELELKRGIRELTGKLKEFADMKLALIQETMRIYDAELLVAQRAERSQARTETILKNY